MKRFLTVFAAAIVGAGILTASAPASAHLKSGAYTSPNGYCQYGYVSNSRWDTTYNDYGTYGYSGIEKIESNIECTASLKVGLSPWMYIRSGNAGSGVQHTRRGNQTTSHGTCQTGCSKVTWHHNH